MSLKLSQLLVLSFGLSLGFFAEASTMNERAVKELKFFLKIPDRKEHYRKAFRGELSFSRKQCSVTVDADSVWIRVRINRENSFLEPSEVEVPSSGLSPSGDRIDVTKVAKFPEAVLVTTYFERRSGSKAKGTLTLMGRRNGEGRVDSLSISDGEGLLDCTNLTDSLYEQEEITIENDEPLL